MQLRLSLRILIVAAAFAFIGDIGSIAGCAAMLGLGVTSLVWDARREGKPVRGKMAGQFGYLLLSTSAFAAFAVLFAPLAQLEATTIALVLLSPLFGLFVYAVAVASCSFSDQASSQS